MELALALNRLWQRRLWVALGAILAVVATIASSHALKKTSYGTASTQMVVDAPTSALGNLKTSLVPYTARAIVYARLMTAPAALDYIGKAAGVPGTEIAATGPAEIGAPTAVHTASVEVNGRLQPPKEKYVLRFDQNPVLPTVDIYSEAPTTGKALALADGAVTGFGRYIHQLDTETNVPAAQEIRIRQLGDAQGGVVAAGTGLKLGILLGFVVLIAWCLLVLWVSGLREKLRTPSRPRREVVDEFDEDIGRLLRERTAVGVGESTAGRSSARGNGGHENGATENGVSENGAHETRARETREPRETRARETREPRETRAHEDSPRENGARVILPYAIDGGGDEETGDRPGSAPARER